MPKPPRISVVTCSYNQGAFIGRTIDSVLAQDYPNLEHIVVDAMSTDDTPRILARYPHLRIFRAPDSGQAEAINKGFRLATGDILCFLNSDDIFYPGTLHRVAREIDPGQGRHIVMGRCRFIDENDRPTGIEHPSAFAGHRRVLEVWKGHALPQPAVFWSREVWQRCGPLDERERLVLDYDLFCRFSQHYPFHVIDQVFAGYRLHSQSKTCSAAEQEVLEQSIRVCRKYWGSVLRRQYWQLLGSYLRFRLDRRKRAIDLVRHAREAWRQQRRLGAVGRVLAGLAFAPDVFAFVLLLPELARRRSRWLDRLGLLERLGRPSGVHVRTLGWRDFLGLHADGWAGPRLSTPVSVEPGQTGLELIGNIELGFLPQNLEVEVWLDSRQLGRYEVGRAGEFALRIPLDGVAPGAYTLQVVSNTYLVVDDFRANEDFRPVVYKLRGVRPLAA